MPRDIRLVLADVDGTLVTKEKILTDRAIRAVEKLRDRGIRFAITSGRPPRGMAMLIDPLKIDQPIAGFNGGVMVRPDLSVVATRTLTPEQSRMVIDLVRQHGADPWIYTGDEWRVGDTSAPHVAREQWTVKFPPVEGDVDAGIEGIVKITGVSDDAALMQKLEHDLQKALADTASAALSQPYYVDVTNKDANKGAVVDTLVEMLDIPAKHILTIGDQPNDMNMFARSGFSIAMGQANDDVKQAATFTTTSSEDEGFARGIEKHVLGEDG